MPYRKKYSLYLLVAILLLIMSCREAAVPRPKGYFRIDLPSHDYVTFNNDTRGKNDLPLTFEYPSYGKISYPEPGWFNIDFSSYDASIYLTYKDIKNNLDTLLEQTYKMNFQNHITKADAINEQLISDPERKVYGILYDLKGNTATSVQFFFNRQHQTFFQGIALLLCRTQSRFPGTGD